MQPAAYQEERERALRWLTGWVEKRKFLRGGKKREKRGRRHRRVIMMVSRGRETEAVAAAASALFCLLPPPEAWEYGARYRDQREREPCFRSPFFIPPTGELLLTQGRIEERHFIFVIQWIMFLPFLLLWRAEATLRSRKEGGKVK